jgi:hypothetical protein
MPSNIATPQVLDARTALEVETQKVVDAQFELYRQLAEFRKVIGRDAYDVIYDAGIGSISQEFLNDSIVLENREELLRRLPKGGRIVEVGTFRGEFARSILDIIQPEELIIVDISFDLFDYVTMSKHPLQGRIKQITGNSYEVMATLQDNYFDMIYIDANHMYEYISRELPIAHQKLRAGGYIVANDYTSYSPLNGHKYGVTKAVNEFVNREGYQVKFFGLQAGGYHDLAFQKPITSEA